MDMIKRSHARRAPSSAKIGDLRLFKPTNPVYSAAFTRGDSLGGTLP
jgi:hypothetical protein